ncbi:MAG: histidine phosphatase family protein [Nocardioides sp.]
MKRLVLLRHGLTPWNAERRFQGQGGVGLHPEGHQQARSVAPVLAGYDPAGLWSSDLQRTQETASYVAQATSLTPVLDERLREIHVGAFTGLTYSEVIEAHGPGPWDFADHGGESGKQVGIRMVAALDDIIAAMSAGSTAIIVSHGAAIRLGVAEFLGWHQDQVESLASLANCGWVELLEGGEGWFSGHPWRLGAYNRIA